VGAKSLHFIFFSSFSLFNLLQDIRKEGRVIKNTPAMSVVRSDRTGKIFLAKMADPAKKMSPVESSPNFSPPFNGFHFR
jgi:hypothetical protein